MQAKSPTGKSNIMSRIVDEMVTNVSGQFRGADSPKEQTEEHSNEQTIKQMDNQTVKQPDSQTLSQANRQSIRRTVGRSINRSSEHHKEQPEEHTEKPVIKHSNGQSVKQDNSGTHILTAMDRSSPPFAHFTERQSALLAFMMHSKNKYITLEYIAYATGLPYASVRTVIRTLRQYKYVLSTGRSRHFKTQYLYYELDEIRCEQFWKEKGALYDFSRPLRWDRNGLIRTSEIESPEQRKEQTKEHPAEHIKEQSLHQTDSQTVKQTDLLSSSIFNTKLLLTEITETFETHPDFVFWAEESLEPNTVLRWIEEFSDVPIKAEDMLLYLSRCSYDLTTLNKKASLKNTPVNYFYGCLKRNKTYLPPQGFKSIEERILEDKRKIVEELENRVRELQELEEKEKQANIEIKFREMMREETGELYNACLNNIPAVFKNSDRSGPGFKTAMKQVFMKSQIADQINGGVSL
ncbi:MAG: hypothetical protein A4E71_02423 [Smithella sp. PtaU1.Bin162]|nr:MAG: hypothetical protein A4E71_02423 [Smithella sp. PtaU1.Bin162]